ncbi:MAG: ComEC/Rec2 family competence protein [Gemmatimonadota bacterium]
MLVTALFLLAGDLGGLRATGGVLGSAGVTAGLAMAAVGLALAAWLLASTASPAPGSLRLPGSMSARASVHPGTRRRGRRAVRLACVAAVLAGLAVGGRAGGAARAACVAGLADGAEVAAAGVLTETVEPRRPARPRRARVSLVHAVLVAGGRRCRVPRVALRFERPAASLRAGRLVAVRGSWRAYGTRPSPLPRPVDAYGALSGSLLASREAAGPAVIRGLTGTTAPRAAGAPPAERVAEDGLGSGDGLAPGPWRRLGLATRARASDRLRDRLPADVVPAARALLLAERGDVDAAMTRVFARAGLAHLLAISGLHVGIVAGGLAWLLGLVPGRRHRYPVAAALGFLYVLWIGAPPSALRAILLFAGYAFARWRGAPARVADLLGLAAAVAILAEPLVIARPGFQLSFAGFAGLLGGREAGSRLASRIRARWPGVSRRTEAGVRAVGASAGAFLFTAPVAAAHFGRVAPAAILSNFVGAPLVALALPALFGTVLLPGGPGRFAADAATGVLRLLFAAGRFVSALPLHGPVSGAGGGWTGLALLGLSAGALGLLLSGRRPWRLVLPMGLVAGLRLAQPSLAGLRGRGSTLVCSLDVGQGDAAAIRTRRGHWIVLDAGPGPGFAPGPRSASRPGFTSRPGFAAGRTGVRVSGGDAGRRVLVPFLRSRGARSVAVFVLSHPHLDHLGGAAALFGSFRVEGILDAGFPVPSRPYLAFLRGVEAERARWLAAGPGARIRVDEVSLTVLGPEPSLSRAEANEASVAVRVRVGDSFSYLTTGDAPAAAERAMLRRWPSDSLRADVLKLGHHGSRTSS